MNDTTAVSPAAPAVAGGHQAAPGGSRRRSRLVGFVAALVAAAGALVLAPAPANAYYIGTDTGLGISASGTYGSTRVFQPMIVRGSGRNAFQVSGILVNHTSKVPADTQQQATAMVFLQKYSASGWVTVDSYSGGAFLIDMGVNGGGIGVEGGALLSGTGPGWYRQVYRVWWGFGSALPYWTITAPGGVSGYTQILPNNNITCTVRCAYSTYSTYVY